MKEIKSKEIEGLVEKLIYQANFVLPENVRENIEKLKNTENSALAKNALEQISKNYKIAEKENLPLCQDTGSAVFYVQMGHEVSLSEPIEKIINRATKKAYKEFYLRKSVVGEPLFERKNTGDNLPAFVHLEQVSGDKIEIIFVPKGGGAENKSRLKMLSPSKGEKGIIDFVLETMQKAGGSACPPFTLGIGIGGTFDTVGFLAKKAIMLNENNSDKRYAELEKKIFSEVEKLKIGTMGLGGEKTLLNVLIQDSPCHIASLPLAVNIQCHSARTAKGIL